MDLNKHVRRPMEAVVDGVRDRRASTRTTQASGRLGEALGRLDQRSAGNADAAVAQIGLDTEASIAQRGEGRARRLLRRVQHVAAAIARREQWLEGRRAALGSTKSRHRLAQVNTFDVRRALIGHLTLGIARIAKPLLAVLMVLVDPLNVYLTVRNRLDVPTSVGMFDVTRPEVLLAFGAAGLVSGVLVSAIGPAGKALALLLFRPRLVADNGEEFVEARESKRRMGLWELVAVLVLVGLVLGFFVAVLFHFAKARFADLLNTVAAADGGGSVTGWLVGLFASLPIVLVLFDTVAHAPQLAHAREVSTWALQARLRQRRDIRRDHRFLRRERRLRRRATFGWLRLFSVLEDVGRRADAEVVDADIDTGKLDVSQLAASFRNEATDEELASSDDAVSRFLPGVRFGTTIDQSLAAFEALPDLLTESPMAAVWRALRADPLHANFDPAASSGTSVTHLSSTSEEANPNRDAA